MKEFIKDEKKRIQNNFIWFNTGGNTLALYDEGRRLFKTMADSFTITRLAPRFDAEGNHTGSDFWLLWKEVGYNNGFQYSHCRIVRCELRSLKKLPFHNSYFTIHNSKVGDQPPGGE